MLATAIVDQDIARTWNLLGGDEVIRRPVATAMDAHDLLASGLPAVALLHLVKHIGCLNSEIILDKAIGMSLRTLQRRKKDASLAVLSVEQSNRTWKFAEILGRAREIFGSMEQAEEWLNQPAIGLDQRRPIDLLRTTAGVEAVEEYLTRIEYGIYT